MSLAESIASVKKVDLSELDLNNLGSWPAAVKVISCVLLLIVALALGYNFYLKDLQAMLDGRRAEEVSLKEQFSSKAFRAANLDAYKAQMREMEESFGALLRQLPSDTEVLGCWRILPARGLEAGWSLRRSNSSPRLLSSSI